MVLYLCHTMQLTPNGAQIHHFQSLGQRYAGEDAPDLQLTINGYGNDAVEMELQNLRYKRQRQLKLKQFVLLVLVYGGWSAFAVATTKSWHLVLWNVCFLLWLLYLLYALFSLVKSEKLLFCLDFALQPQTVRFLSRTTNVFIPATSIHDVVINEVIEDLDVHYVLIVRTKGNLFKRTPIITLFNTLRPSVECLELIYKSLNKVMQKNK